MSMHGVDRARRSRRFRLAAFAMVVMAATGSLAGAQRIATPGIKVPSGYRVVQRALLAKGVYHYELLRRDPAQRIHVARIPADAQARVRAVISRGRIAGPQPRMERTSAMCRRADCLAAINSSFFNTLAKPLGAVVIAGEPVQSSRSPKVQFMVSPDKSLHLGALYMPAKVTALYPKRVGVADLQVTIDGYEEERTVDLAGINVYRKADQIILYTSRLGPRTMTKRGGVELLAQLVDTKRVMVDRPVTLRPTKLVWGGNQSIPRGGVVLSAHGAGADRLVELWRDIRSGKALREVTLSVPTSPKTYDTVAGRPVLLRDGKLRDTGSSWFARSRQPRSVVGWNAAGDVLMVTIDGRQPGAAGMSLEQAARLMKSLGAVAALNLDGGGSTTFVERGRVENAPSDVVVLRNGRQVRSRTTLPGDRVRRRVERVVAASLMVVRT